MSQKELADAVGASERTIGNWERSASVPRNKEARIRDVLSLRTAETDRHLTAISDVELLGEIARRFSDVHKAMTELDRAKVERDLANAPAPTVAEERSRAARILTSQREMVAFLESINLDDEARTSRLLVADLEQDYTERYGAEALAELLASHDPTALVETRLSNVVQFRSDPIEGHEPPMDAAAFKTGAESEYERQVREQDEHGERPDV